MRDTGRGRQKLIKSRDIINGRPFNKLWLLLFYYRVSYNFLQDGVNTDSQDSHSSLEPEKVHQNNNNNNNNNNVENQSSKGGSESDVRSQKKVPISNDKRELW